MIKIHSILLLSTTLLFACNPFSVKYTETQAFIDKAVNTSRKVSQGYKAEIRKITPYKVYRYQKKLSDPFRARDFAIQKTADAEPAIAVPQECKPPSCVPPKPHPRQLLENYNLAALKFVGTLMNNRHVGLIKTPDYGVVEVKVGEYIGKNNGKVIAVNPSSIILQEKILKNGLWKNKKTVLVIRQ